MSRSFLFQHVILSSLLVTTFGGCLFPLDWTGRWFQLDAGHLSINATHFESKGQCVQKDGDKYVVKESSEGDSCRRCLAVYKRHDNVIQYKESDCLTIESLEELCHEITGDQPLMSLFRADNASTIPCPFKAPPYKFSYNRGSGECSQNSRIDSCTDDSKLHIYFAACPDISGTESGVEVLSCLATWKEGNSKYLVGKIKQQLGVSDEETYRCFMYGKRPDQELVYQVAQSAEATCTGVTSPSDGSKTMVLTRLESGFERCKFPSWVVGHHHWLSLDGKHSYHFSHRNATLRVSQDHGPTEMKLVCHHVVSNGSTVTLVAHSTIDCKNGYICMVFQKRDDGVIQVQRSNDMVQENSEACVTPFTDSYRMSSPVILTIVSLPLVTCPQAGQYVVSGGAWGGSETDNACSANTSLHIGCHNSPQLMTLQTCSPDSSAAYHCHGTWAEEQTTYVIGSAVSRKSVDAKRYCFVLSQRGAQATLHRLTDSCTPPSTTPATTLNLTLLGSCEKSSSSASLRVPVVPALVVLLPFVVLR